MSLAPRRRIAPQLPALALLLAIVACADRGNEAGPDAVESPLGARGTAVDADAFCGPVRARVESWLADRRGPEGEPSGGTVVVAGGADVPMGMNAFATADALASEMQTFVNLMTLVRYDAELRPVPWLAERWELSDDGASLTFHLRDDVYWHDGERTDAHDVAFTFRRMSDPRTAYPNAAFWTPYLAAAPGRADADTEARWGPGAGSVEVLDSLTVRLHFAPHPDPLDAWRAVAIMPEHLLGDVPPEELRGHPYGTSCPVGNGPFVFREYLPEASWRFAANPAFPDELGGRPGVARLVYRVIPEASTLLADFTGGDVHVYLSVLPDHAPRIRQMEGAHLERFVSRAVVALVWNSRRPWFSDARVRRALSMALDREAIVQGVFQGFGSAATSSVPPFHWAHEGGDGDTSADLEGAAALLDAAGWQDRDGDGVRENAEGVPLRFELYYSSGNATRRAIAQVVRAQLAPLGAVAEPTLVEYATLLERVMEPEPRDFDALVLGWSNDFRVDDHDIFHSEAATGPYGWSGTSDPRLDALIDSLRTTVERDAARPLWRRYQDRVQEVQPWSWLVYNERVNGVRDVLGGVVMDVRGDLVGVQGWELAPDRR